MYGGVISLGQVEYFLHAITSFKVCCIGEHIEVGLDQVSFYAYFFLCYTADKDAKLVRPSSMEFELKMIFFTHLSNRLLLAHNVHL